MEMAARYDIELFDYPFLEREILQEGIYRDPSRAEDAPNPLYTVIPVTLTLPSSVQSVLLQELCIPDEDIYEETRSGLALNEDFVVALVNGAMVRTGNEDDMIEAPTRSRDKWRPSGRIQVWDDAVQGLIPLKGAKVRCRRWATYHVGITDADGYFTCDGMFKRPGNYSIIWERAYWDIRNGAAQALYNGPKITGPWNLEITGGLSIHNASVHRAAHRWWYDEVGELSRPNIGAKLKIKVKDENGRSKFQLTTPGIRDIVIYGKNGGASRRTDDIFSSAAHEIGHAVHAVFYSRSAFNNMNSIWKESWAMFAQWIITREEYTPLGVFDTVIDEDDPNNMYIIDEANPKPPIIIRPPKDAPILRIAVIRGPAQLPKWLVNQNTWNINMDPNDIRHYSPIYIDLVDRSNQRRDYYNGSAFYPDDDIRGIPVGDIVNIAMRCTSISYFEFRLRQYLDNTYEMQYITEDTVNRYLEIYKRFL